MFTIKQDDTLPVLRRKLGSGDFSADLTGATVTLNSWLKETQAAHITGGACTVEDAEAGEVSFTFSAAQTATPGIYECEFSVDYGGGSVGTWPTKGYIEFEIEAEIA